MSHYDDAREEAYAQARAQRQSRLDHTRSGVLSEFSKFMAHFRMLEVEHPSRETSLAKTKLQEAFMWIKEIPS